VNIRFGKQILATALAACTAVGSAQAAVVPSWAWQNNAGFVAYTETVPGTVVATGSVPDLGALAYTRLTWPREDPLHQSNLHVAGTGIASGSNATAAVTNGPATFGVNLTHDNFPITAGGDLVTAVLRDKLWLSPNPGPAFPVNPGDPIIPPLQFDIHFAETPNLGNGGFCADGTPVGVGLNSAGCADLFGVQAASAFVQQFVYDGQTYKITIAANGLGPQNHAFCAAVNLNDGCVGFRTAENQSNDLNPFFRIETVDVPEPGLLALLGVGLAMLGFTRRRNSKV
jgi:hypothetical protein